MVDAINTSFIPKKTHSSPKKRRGGSVDLIPLISAVIFVLTLVTSVGVFVYKNYLDKKIQDNKIMLEREKNNFDVTSVEQLARLDKRLVAAKELLNNHIDLTSFFELLQENTLKNVKFETFKFSKGNEGIDVFMEGSARSYSTVALQSDAFGKNPYIKENIFSNLNINNFGDVVFDFSASVDNDFLLYKNNFE